jgi:hypothetical protein
MAATVHNAHTDKETIASVAAVFSEISCRYVGVYSVVSIMAFIQIMVKKSILSMEETQVALRSECRILLR